MPLCGLPSLVLFGAYGLAGMAHSVRMLQHRINGQPWNVFREEAYTPEGQRLLRVFQRFWGPTAVTVVGLALSVGGGILCLLTDPSSVPR